MTRRDLNRWGNLSFLALALLSASGAAAASAADPKLPAAGPTLADITADSDTVAAPSPTDTADQTAPDAATPDPKEVACMAKVIIHEAGGESHTGQVAVAQVIRARMHDRRFSASACGVARQHGQFFDVDAYNPAQDSPRWQNAVAIATDTLAGGGDDVAPGALFFHAVRSGVPGNRVRIAQIGGHLFYR